MKTCLPVASLAALLLFLAGCATPPKPTAAAAAPVLSFAATKPLAGGLAIAGPYLGDRQSALTGRTLMVDSIHDIVLRDKEVVLTFDDGPMPGKTPKVLDALDAKGVKATFLMVGQMARTYPAIVRQVAARGHTIGTHTQDHANLSGMAVNTALAEIDKGQKSVAAALVPMQAQPAPFFRFPYLADTPVLRQALANRGTVVIDVNVDSKDYFVSSPADLQKRGLERLDARGSGIILFHDIHARTVAMLPGFLDALEARGYTVVNLVPGKAGAREMLLSQAGS
jgi:peptidoglycan/xylan/chitin deacetylase (PgdA/CDA1 family)